MKIGFVFLSKFAALFLILQGCAQKHLLSDLFADQKAEQETPSAVLPLALQIQSASSEEDPSSKTTPFESKTPQLDEVLGAKNESFALCPALNSHSLSITAYTLPDAMSRTHFEREVCSLTARRSPVLATFTHEASCQFARQHLLNSYLAREIGNSNLFAPMQAAEINRSELTKIADQAAFTFKHESAFRWNLLATFLKSWSIAQSPQLSRREKIGGNTIGGIVVFNDTQVSPFREFENAVKMNLTETNQTISRQPSTPNWIADDTPSWKLLSDSRSTREIVSNFKLAKAIQQVELMADLADYTLITAIKGPVNESTSLELTDQTYTLLNNQIIIGKNNNNTPVGRKKNNTTQIKRLRVAERDCTLQVTPTTDSLARLRNVKHLRSTTYYRILALSQKLKVSRESDTGLDQASLRTLEKNVEKTAQFLYRACVNRSLKLDLDLGSLIFKDESNLKKPAGIFGKTTDQACEDSRISLGGVGAKARQLKTTSQSR